MRLAGVRQLSKPDIIEQAIGQPYLFAAAFELAEITEPEDLFHGSLLNRSLGNIDSDDRNLRLAVGL